MAPPVPAPSAPEPDAKPDVAVWILLGVVFTLPLVLPPLIAYKNQATGGPAAIGTVIGTLLMPAIVIGLFSLSPRFRNLQSRLKIYVWTVLVLVLLQLQTLLSAS